MLKKYLALLLAGLVAALSLPITALAETSVPEVTEITFEEISIIEGTHGYKDWKWDSETQTKYDEYFCYDITPEFTVTLKNGRVDWSANTSYKYNGRWYNVRNGVVKF